MVFSQYYNNGTGWELVYFMTTTEQGSANFSFEYTGGDLQASNPPRWVDLRPSTGNGKSRWSSKATIGSSAPN